MTPPNLQEHGKAGSGIWNDGFLGRFSFVAVASKQDSKIATLDAGIEIPIPEDLKAELRDYHARLGIPECSITEIIDENNKKTGRFQIEREELPEHRCEITPEANEAYKRYRKALKTMLKDFPHDDLNASYDRLAGTALRMSLLMGSLGNNHHIELRHWAKAQEQAEIMRKSVHRIYDQTNGPRQQTAYAKIEEDILSEMKKWTERGFERITASQLRNKSRNLKAYGRAYIEEMMLKLCSSEFEKHTTAKGAKCFSLK
ncbi:hypothetical protein [Dictyobacter kobayashii]|uniref:Uncharacterized protein n=1 Tax=Dictyobacter kobayashii TaxID=2014872 RepID=A0A402AIP6_9CHLR|nr:hypothetical protein [Dictyobacter kobayashii]GCE18959.1 hypothetical protein KDK_27590 [Dictyobacter kobayashii]